MQCRQWRPLTSVSPRLLRRTLSTHASVAPVVLRPYQELCIASCTEALATGSTRIGVSLPTGSGKTTVFISLLERIQPPPTNAEATRALIIVNSIELARQAAAQVSKMFPHWVVELEQGAKNQATGAADVTIATYQTLNNEQRLMKFESKMMKAIIIDEAHHAAAPSYRRLLSQFHPDIKHPEGIEIDEPPHKIPIIGFSATFSRHDGIALGAVFERIVYHRDFLEMIKEQWLCNMRFTSVKVEMNLSKVALNPASKDFNTASLARVVNSLEMNHVVVRSWLDRASERKSTLVFCVNIAHVKELTQTFRGYGVDARYITANTIKTERQELIEAFKNGEFPVLVNCAILTEGADIPNVDCVVLARPTRSRNLFAQMVGRGMRLSPGTGKTDCRIIDFVDAHSQGGGVVSMPTLFGLEVGEFDVDDETIDSLEERMDKNNKAAIRRMALAAAQGDAAAAQEAVNKAYFSAPNPFDITYIDHDDAFGLVEELAQDSSTRRISSRFAWVNCGQGVWMLALHEKGYITVEPTEYNTGNGPAPYVEPDADVEAYEAQAAAARAAEFEDESQGQHTKEDVNSSSSGVEAPVEPLFRALFTPRNPNPNSGPTYTPFYSSRTILVNMPLRDAVRACDHFVVNKLFKATSAAVLYNNAPWRKELATNAQLELISKMRKSHKGVADASGTGDLSKVTKGQAATMIARLKHGGMDRYKKMIKQQAKVTTAVRKQMMEVPLPEALRNAVEQFAQKGTSDNLKVQEADSRPKGLLGKLSRLINRRE